MKHILQYLFFVGQIYSFKNNIIIKKQNYKCFDRDFAESISKPLPMDHSIENHFYNNTKTHILSSDFLSSDSSNKIEKEEIYFPGFFEIFPELEFKWPLWVMKKGKRLQCKRDEDCMFPQSCCHHPIIPGDKFCCTGGYKQRTLQYVFVGQEIKSDLF
jgi:hypothetical protein